jgi:catalase
LSQLPAEPGRIDGRTIAVLAADMTDAAGILALASAATASRARVQVVAPHLGAVLGEDGTPVPAVRAFLTSESVEFDAVVIAGGAGAAALALEPAAAMFVQEAYRHHKTIGAWGDAVATLGAFSIPADASGVVTADAAGPGFVTELLEQVGWHRHWDRAPLSILAMAPTS